MGEKEDAYKTSEYEKKYSNIRVNSYHSVAA
jgi:hypothetical protein